MSSQVLEQQDYRLRAFMVGLRAALPLTLAIVPWGLLAGSFALEAGLSGVEGQAMSVFVFAGAVQLVVLGMIGTNAGLSAILITTFLITSRHFPLRHEHAQSYESPATALAPGAGFPAH